MHRMMVGPGAGFAGPGLLGALVMLIFFLLVVTALVLVIRYLWIATPLLRGSSALEVLKMRYAQGEIDKEDFEQRKNALK